MRFYPIFIFLFVFGCGSVTPAGSDNGQQSDTVLPDSGKTEDEGSSSDVSEDIGLEEDLGSPNDEGAVDTSSGVDTPSLEDLSSDDVTSSDTGVSEDVGSGTGCVPDTTETCVSVCNTVGTQTCDENGEWGVCWPPAETCNGVDDDCDNIIDNADEGCDCVDNSTQSCGSDEGECVAGVQACVAGQWGDCGGANMVLPSDEICDQLDNDCNGITDDTDGAGCECEAGETQPCGTNVGACTTGVTNCENGFWGVCDGVGPVAEVCNSVDDDCNGALDDVVGGCFDAAGTFQLINVNALGLEMEMSTDETSCVGQGLTGCIIPVQANDTVHAKCSVPPGREIVGFGDSDLSMSIACPGTSCLCESSAIIIGQTYCTYTRVMPANSVTFSCTVISTDNLPDK
jgi:hypothetical protein